MSTMHTGQHHPGALAMRQHEHGEPTNQSPEPQESACPWCGAYMGSLKQVLMYMESAHHRRWCDLALYPPIVQERG
jgi:hypothetical protein